MVIAMASNYSQSHLPVHLRLPLPPKHRPHILKRLIRKLEILLNRDRIQYLRPNKRGSNEQAPRKQGPTRGEFVHKGGLEGIDAVYDAGAGGLDAFVKAGEVGELAAVVGHGAHEPVDAGLPGS